ncbi:MAG: hypothetical protein WEF50_21280 [Myxococcota bacterium]
MEFETRCRSLLPHLARDGHGVRFHVAATDAPAVQSSWTSAHLALALWNLDPALALAELRSLYASCQRDEGLLASERVAGDHARAERTKAVGPIFGEDERSLLISPPVAAFAAARMARADGIATRDLLECATRELDAIWGERLPPDTPLPVILHPLESGVPRSALFDPLVDSEDDDEWSDDSATLFRSAAACQLDPERALRAGHPFVIEDPVFCGWLLLALEECALAWEKLADTTVCRKLRIRSSMIADGIASRLWWEEQEIYAGWNRGRQSALRAVTAGGLVPAASRALAEEGTPKRVVERHLRPAASALWSSRGISFTPPHRKERDELEARGERPDAASPLAHYWAHRVLLGADRPADARVARKQLEELALARGFQHVYEITPDEPEAAAADVSAWPMLALEMDGQERALG